MQIVYYCTMEIDDRIAALEQLVRDCPAQYRIDLANMLNPIYRKRTAMSQELIECRKRGRPTLHYNELLKEFNDLANNFEQYAMMANLMR